MSTDVSGIRDDAPLSEAVARLKARDGAPLPVYDEGRLVGILTEHDIINWQAQGRYDLANTSVRDVMNRESVAILEDEDVREAADKMRERHIPGLVVLSKRDHQPIGTVTFNEVAAQARGAPAAAPAPTDQYTAYPMGYAGQTTAQMAQPMPRAERERERAPEEAPPARIFLQPIAAPSILGLLGFAGATFIVSAQLAGWYGSLTSPFFLAPFAAIFGGLAQFLAGMWAYRARDGLATAVHGTWGSFWMAYGILYLMAGAGALTLPTGGFPELGYWFIVLAAVTWVAALAALADNISVASVLITLAAGSTLLAIAFLINSGVIQKAGGLVLVASAILAWYTASAMMLENTFGKVVLPLGKLKLAANIPGRQVTTPIQYAMGEPGVKAGQ
jgi:succinate-acetate transporter protein